MNRQITQARICVVCTQLPAVRTADIREPDVRRHDTGVVASALAAIARDTHLPVVQRHPFPFSVRATHSQYTTLYIRYYYIMWTYMARPKMYILTFNPKMCTRLCTNTCVTSDTIFCGVGILLAVSFCFFFSFSHSMTYINAR